MKLTRFLQMALGFYLLAAGLGLVLRAALVAQVPLTFTHALHAHSHTLYFGWGALLLFTLLFHSVGAEDAGVRRGLWGVGAVSASTFAAFLHSGYGRPGIVVSSLSLVAWAVCVTLFVRRAKGQGGVDLTFMRVAVGYVVIAGASAGLRVVFLVLKLTDPLPGRLAVFSFLHAFAAFFAFGTMGLTIRHLAQRGADVPTRWLTRQLWLMAPLSALTFPLGVAGGMSSALGPVARGAAAVLLVPSCLWLASLWRMTRALPRAEAWAFRSTGVMWALKALMELGGALGLADSAAAARHPVILYLHVVLLGFITATFFLLVRPKGASLAPLALHQVGVVVMSAALGVAGLPAFWPPAGAWVLSALWAAVWGGGLVFLAGVLAAGLWGRRLGDALGAK